MRRSRKRRHKPADVRILIVDDEPSIISFVEQTMRLAGYQTLTASNAKVALENCETDGMPDLLLTDFKMPGMDGDALAARLRQREPDLKVLYLTGFADQLFRTSARCGTTRRSSKSPAPSTVCSRPFR